ncbi:hypothetical protein BCR44DRAFT_234092 [Catenaria anguillulae PL171]|uniref:Uncharacterized protein n=1 Tax=Catenaria anguillulae PL171 TaxID=765915 RepID=A0A1Y2GI79_9FUNG|nr:hypothetical protein BCR44DRAFT_1508479 [Catenaria anguillulae PL171]ORZ34453.1 hypothetical protein BCR44DRAFT_234092 [Catenaria anguillulae PL171]
MMAKAPTKRLPHAHVSPPRSRQQRQQQPSPSPRPPTQIARAASSQTRNGSPSTRAHAPSHHSPQVALRQSHQSYPTNVSQPKQQEHEDVIALKKRLKKALIRLKSYHHHMDLLLRERADLMLATASSVSGHAIAGLRDGQGYSHGYEPVHRQEQVVQIQAQAHSPAVHQHHPAPAQEALGQGWRHPLARQSLGSLAPPPFSAAVPVVGTPASSYIVFGNDRHSNPLDFPVPHPEQSTIVQHQGNLNDLSGAMLDPRPTPLTPRECCIVSPIPTSPYRPRPPSRSRLNSTLSSQSSSVTIDDSTLALIAEFERGGNELGHKPHGTRPRQCKRAPVKQASRSVGVGTLAPPPSSPHTKHPANGTQPVTSAAVTSKSGGMNAKALKQERPQAIHPDPRKGNVEDSVDEDEVAQVTAFLNRHTLGGCGGSSSPSSSLLLSVSHRSMLHHHQPK